MAPGMSRTVLVVEDEQDTRAMMSALLECHGFAVATAANGREGLVEARRLHPCVIVLDLMMPIMSGEQFRRAQLEEPDIRDIPVVVLSARHDAAEVARQFKAAGFMPKPLDVDELVWVIEHQCH
jgi:CheY-like chemotaxis protein